MILSNDIYIFFLFSRYLFGFCQLISFHRNLDNYFNTLNHAFIFLINFKERIDLYFIDALIKKMINLRDLFIFNGNDQFLMTLINVFGKKI